MSERVKGDQIESPSIEQSSEPSGFAAGTMVHTKEGLVPIEQIKVGDWVLSKSESIGEQAYKRVLKTFAYSPTTVMRVGYALEIDRNRAYPIITTLNCVFPVVEEGRVASMELPNKFYRGGMHFECADGTYALVSSCGKLYATDKPNVGWSPSHMGDVKEQGSLWDYAKNQLIATGEFALDAIRNEEMDDPYLKLSVYNLEVEDFHTFYVGEYGVWVSTSHNSSIK